MAAEGSDEVRSSGDAGWRGTSRPAAAGFERRAAEASQRGAPTTGARSSVPRVARAPARAAGSLPDDLAHGRAHRRELASQVLG